MAHHSENFDTLAYTFPGPGIPAKAYQSILTKRLGPLFDTREDGLCN